MKNLYTYISRRIHVGTGMNVIKIAKKSMENWSFDLSYRFVVRVQKCIAGVG